MFPLEEGVWGNRGSPKTFAVRFSGSLRTLPLRWSELKASASNLVCVRGGLLPAQHKMTYPSVEAERGAAQSMATDAP